jgi:predicted porin
MLSRIRGVATLPYFKTTVAAYAALAAIAFADPAKAADLGGNCCNDLEERVAELEATTAKKGNRKVSVRIYGQVNKAVLWMDGLLADQDKNVIDNSASPTHFGVSGSGKIDKDWSAGFVIEIGLGGADIPILQDEMRVRHALVYVEHKMLGRLTVGHTSMATDNITRITTANTDVVAPMLSLAPLSTAYLFGLDLPYNNIRRDLVKWDSSTFGGFHVSASVANGDTPFGIGFHPDHAIDVALRYAGEFSGFRVAAGVGYRDESYTLTTFPLAPLFRDKVLSGSASVMHMASGLFAAASAGSVKKDLLFGDFTNWHVQAGWQKKVWTIGATTLYAEYGSMKIDGVDLDPTVMGIGVVQSVDAAALDVYLGFRQYDLDFGGDKVNAVTGGMRIRF